MENRIAIEGLIEALDGRREIVIQKPDFCIFPLRGVPWELLTAPAYCLTRQCRKLIGAHLQVFETEVHHDTLVAPYILLPTCFFFVQLSGQVSFHDEGGRHFSGSDDPCVSLSYHPAGSYQVKLAKGRNSFIVVAFEEYWPIVYAEYYPAFAPLMDAWLAGAPSHFRLPPMPLSNRIMALLHEIRLIHVRCMEDGVHILHLLGKAVFGYHGSILPKRVATLPSIQELKDILVNYVEENYIDENACRSDHVRKKLLWSKKLLQKVARKGLGCPLKSYVLKVRLEKACILLVHSEMTIGNIATEVGFSSLSYFTSVFRRSKGIYPTAYRTKEKKQEGQN